MNNPMHDLDNLEVQTIKIENHEYSPSEVTVKQGEVIKIVNNDKDEHTLTADSGEFDIEIKPGNQEELYAPKVGEYTFYCRYHENMRGMMKVE